MPDPAPIINPYPFTREALEAFDLGAPRREQQRRDARTPHERGRCNHELAFAEFNVREAFYRDTRPLYARRTIARFAIGTIRATVTGATVLVPHG